MHNLNALLQAQPAYHWINNFPPSARRLFIIGIVYACIEGLKIPKWMSNHFRGWWCVLANVLFTSIGIYFIDADVRARQAPIAMLVTMLISCLASAGLHGTMDNLTRTENTHEYLKRHE